MNNRTLLFALLLFLGIYGLVRLVSGQREHSFRAELIRVDTALVTTIIIDPEGREAGEFILNREAPGWFASNDTVTIAAPPGMIRDLLSSLALIRTERIAARDPDGWRKYQTTETSGARVRIYQHQTLLEDFILGRPGLSPTLPVEVAYLRLTGQEEVYVVDGLQMKPLALRFAAYRDYRLLHLSPEIAIRSIDFQWPDTLFRITQSDGKWRRDGGALLDSTAVTDYLSSLRDLRGDQFADDIDELRLDLLEQFRITFRGEETSAPVNVYIYRDSTRTRPFVIHCSQHPKTFFSSDSAGVFRQLYRLPGLLVAGASGTSGI